MFSVSPTLCSVVASTFVVETRLLHVVCLRRVDPVQPCRDRSSATSQLLLRTSRSRPASRLSILWRCRWRGVTILFSLLNTGCPGETDEASFRRHGLRTERMRLKLSHRLVACLVSKLFAPFAMRPTQPIQAGIGGLWIGGLPPMAGMSICRCCAPSGACLKRTISDCLK